MPKIVVSNTEFKGKEFELTDESISIGRMEDNQIEIPEASMSSHHAFFNKHESGNFILKDNASTNGTFLNGDKLTGEKLLKPDDKIRFGQLMIDYISEIGESEEMPTQTEEKTDQKPASEKREIPVSPTPAAPVESSLAVKSAFKGLKKDKSPLTMINIILTLIALLALTLLTMRILGFI